MSRDRRGDRDGGGGGGGATDDWPLECKVYVGGLPADTEASEVGMKTELEDVFSRYGRLKKVWVARRPPGFAFLEFEDARDAEDAVRALDGTRMCGVRARVEMSSGRRRNQGGGGRGGGGGYSNGYGGGGGRDSYGGRGGGDRDSYRRDPYRDDYRGGGGGYNRGRRTPSPARGRSRSRTPPPRRPRSRSRSPAQRSPSRSPVKRSRSRSRS